MIIEQLKRTIHKKEIYFIGDELNSGIKIGNIMRLYLNNQAHFKLIRSKYVYYYDVIIHYTEKK